MPGRDGRSGVRPVFGVHEVCRACHGSGINKRGACAACDGTGVTVIDRNAKPPIRVARPSRAKAR